MRIKAFVLLSAILLASVAGTGCSSVPTVREPAASGSGLVELPSSRIEYFSQGSGPTVVLLPGGSLTVSYMEDLAQALDDAGHRVVRVNFRGAGKSTGSGESVTLHTLAADVAGVIDALNLQQVTIAGHAFGNRVARQLAADRPDLVTNVVLIAAGGKVAPKPEADQALATIFNPASTDVEVLKAMDYMVGDPGDAAATWEVIKSARAPMAAGIQRTAAQNTPLAEWWAPQGEARYLVLQGTRDQVAPAENGQLLKQELGARVTLVDMPGQGHMMFVTAPGQTADAIASFLSR